MSPCSNKPSHIYATNNLSFIFPCPWAESMSREAEYSKPHTQSLLYSTKPLVTPSLWVSHWHMGVCHLHLFSHPVLQLHFTLLCQIFHHHAVMKSFVCIVFTSWCWSFFVISQCLEGSLLVALFLIKNKINTKHSMNCDIERPVYNWN